MSKNVKAIPDGYHTATPYLRVKGAAKAIDFYKQAFGAQELFRMPGPDGKIMHAEIQIGDSRLMVGEECAEGPSAKSSNGTLGVSVFLYLEDVDRVFQKAKAAGARETTPLQDMFWGDRYGTLTDPFGQLWQLATHKEDVPPEEIAQRSQAALASK